MNTLALYRVAIDTICDTNWFVKRQERYWEGEEKREREIERNGKNETFYPYTHRQWNPFEAKMDCGIPTHMYK